MKDQGKMSELNKSSHCYQSSNTEGRMSETYTPQNSPNFSGVTCEVEPGKGLQRTKSRNKRRRRALQKRREQRLAALPENATYQDIQRAHDPKGYKIREAARSRKIERANRHAGFLEFMRQYNMKYASQIRCTKFNHRIFCSIYSPGEPYVVRPEHLEALHSALGRKNVAIGALSPSINFDHFPNALPKTTEYPISVTWDSFVPPYTQEYFDGHISWKPSDYVPQSGNLSSCVHAKEAVEICVSDVLDTMVEAASVQARFFDPILDWCDLPRDLFSLVLHLITFRKPVCSLVVVLTTYVLALFVRDVIMTLRFAFGFMTGSFLTAKSKKSSGLFDQLYSPQAGVLNSDDGAAFKGTQVKKKNFLSGTSAPASASSPGTTVAPTFGFSQPMRTAPPKPTRKDPNDGPLNGFGVGI